MSFDPLRDLRGADPYSLLGVDRDADPGTIVSAHRRLIRLTHPDLADGDAERTKLLNLARTVLLDPDLRADFDSRTTPDADPPPAPSVWNESDVKSGPGSSPNTDPSPAPSAWSETDVISGPGPSPSRAFPYPSYANQAPTSNFVPPRYQHVEPASNTLGILSLVMTMCLCGPAGFILAILALAHGRRTATAGRVCAWIAIVVAVVEVVVLAMFYVVLLTSSDTFSSPHAPAST